MKRQARRDTKPELLLRSELHRRGLRFRVDQPVLPGLRRRGDIVFPRARLVVFVDGCFWHSCPQHGTVPKRNTEWWIAKLRLNVDRDRDTGDRLLEAGWHVMRIWEHEAPQPAAERVERTLAVRKGLILGEISDSRDCSATRQS